MTKTKIMYSKTNQSPSGMEYAPHHVCGYSKWRITKYDSGFIKEDLVEQNITTITAEKKYLKQNPFLFEDFVYGIKM